MDAQVRYPQSRYHLSLSAERQLLFRNQIPWIASLTRYADSATTFGQLNQLLTGRLLNDDLLERSEQRILNLRTAVSFVISSPQGYDLVTFGHINDLLTEGIGLNGGELRQQATVTLGGADVQIPIPEAEKVQRELLGLRLIHSDYTDRALQTLTYLLRQQLFRDANLTTAFLVANQIMLKRGAGLLMVTPDQLPDFKEVLLQFYRGADGEELRRWLYQHAIYGPEELA